MLAAKENKELIWFQVFIENILKHVKRDSYLEFIKPILLEAAAFAKNEITICKLNRVGLDIKFWRFYRSWDKNRILNYMI